MDSLTVTEDDDTSVQVPTVLSIATVLKEAIVLLDLPTAFANHFSLP